MPTALPPSDASTPTTESMPDARVAPAASTTAYRSRSALRWPGVCAVCRSFASGRVCAACLARFAPERERCRRCALPLPGAPAATVCGACAAQPTPFAAAVAAVDYAFPWSGLLADFKFHGASELSRPFAASLAAALQRRADIAPDLVLPVPLAGARLRARGYNQAWELARRVARALRWRADATLLIRVRDTPHQLALPPGERAGNVRGAFAIEPLRRAEVDGRHVLVVDDVMTTAHTAAEVARVLLAANAARVSIAVFARTPRPDAD